MQELYFSKHIFNVYHISILIRNEVTMKTRLTNKTISVTELREPGKVIDKAGSQPVAVLNRSNVVGYFVPASAVEKLDFSACETDEVMSALNTLDPKALAVNDYLKDK